MWTLNSPTFSSTNGSLSRRSPFVSLFDFSRDLFSRLDRRTTSEKTDIIHPFRKVANLPVGYFAARTWSTRDLKESDKINTNLLDSSITSESETLYCGPKSRTTIVTYVEETSKGHLRSEQIKKYILWWESNILRKGTKWIVCKDHVIVTCSVPRIQFPDLHSFSIWGRRSPNIGTSPILLHVSPNTLSLIGISRGSSFRKTTEGSEASLDLPKIKSYLKYNITQDF